MVFFMLHWICTCLHCTCTPENIKTAIIQAERREAISLFNNQFNPYAAQNPMFQRSPYSQPAPQMYAPQPMQQPIAQEPMIQVRFIGSREEAVASNVMPGMPCWLVDRANGKAYFKSIDPQTGVSDLEEYTRTQQPAVQYVTVEALEEYRQQIERQIEQRLAALQSKVTTRKAVTVGDE